jgi:hypothetical protein
MTAPTKRPFWQMHLSTVVLMMLLFGALLTLALTFNSAIEAWFLKLVKAEAITASDINPATGTPLMPMYLAVNIVATLFGGVVIELVTRRLSRAKG